MSYRKQPILLGSSSLYTKFSVKSSSSSSPSLSLLALKMGEKEKEKEKGKEKEKEKEKVEVITAVYKVNLHCHQCGREIKKPLTRTEGIQSVEIDVEKNEIKVKGSNLDVLRIHKRIEKLSKKKVELISPIVKPKEKESSKTDIKVKETKQLISRIITAKVHLHCAKCEHDLKKKLIKHKSIYSVKTDIKTQTLTVEGTIEADKFKIYLKKKMKKHVEIMSEKKEEKKEEKKTEHSKSTEKKESEKGKEISLSETTTTIEIKEEVKTVEVKAKDSNSPYFIHYVYAPQLFSDENPNACHVM